MRMAESIAAQHPPAGRREYFKQTMQRRQKPRQLFGSRDYFGEKHHKRLSMETQHEHEHTQPRLVNNTLVPHSAGSPTPGRVVARIFPCPFVVARVVVGMVSGVPRKLPRGSKIKLATIPQRERHKLPNSHL